MFSTNLKRSVATLGVVAGLLAAAVPASAGTPKGVMPSSPNDALTVKAPTVSNAEVFELNTLGGNDTLDATGTQVGSEGIWAPGDGSDLVMGKGIWAPGDGSDLVMGNSAAPGR